MPEFASELGYLTLLQHLLDKGVYKPNRTGVATYADVGHMLKYDLRHGFPATTTKQLFFKAVKGELLGFFRGYDNAADFRDLGCKVWDQNANETPAWLQNPHRKGTDDLGRIYGVQWTRWRDTRVARSKEQAVEMAAKGYEEVAYDPARQVWVFEREINQLETALRTLLTNPNDRRVIVSGWRVDELDQASLPPCHVAYQWVAMPDNTLHMTMWQRSADTLLGMPFNQASCALFLSIMARLCGREAATVTIFTTDTHLYENHVDVAKEQLTRTLLPAPKLALSDRIARVERVEDIAGVFSRIEPEDIWLENYQHQGPLRAPMAA